MTTTDEATDEPSDAFADLDEMMRTSPDAARNRVRAEIDPDVLSARRRRRRRGLTITAVVLALILAASGGYVAWALNAPLAAPVVTAEPPEAPRTAPATISLPTAGAAAISITGAEAYLGEGASGTWMASGGDEQRSIASISKLITALVILDAKPLSGPDDPGPTIWFDEADNDLYDEYYVMGATIAAMPTGSSMSLHDALATMLIPSASNYAEAVSTWAFGSQSAFVRATRDWLDTHGLTGTTIVEPTGINPRNVSTPTDLLAIARLAAADPTIAQITATRSLFLPVPGTLNNTNDLLGIDGITGLKTGNLGENAHNLLFTASVDVATGERLGVTGIILGGATHDSVNNSVRVLLQSIRVGFHRLPLATAGQSIGTYTTPWGESADLVMSGAASISTWSDTPVTVSMDLTSPLTYESGERVGTVTWTAGPQTAKSPVEIRGAIEPPSAWWRLTHPGELGAG